VSGAFVIMLGLHRTTEALQYDGLLIRVNKMANRRGGFYVLWLGGIGHGYSVERAEAAAAGIGPGVLAPRWLRGR